MKTKFLILVSVLLGVTSCSSIQTYYQVCEVRSNLPTTADGCYQYQDADCTVTYDFWCDGGNPGFVFTNNLDEIIYVDLSKSFFIKNGKAYDYFLNRQYSSSTANTVSSTSSKTGSVFGYWNFFPRLVPGSFSVASTSANSTSNSNSIEYTEKSIIAIPPHTSKSISEYLIDSSYFYECGYNIEPTKKETPTYNFTTDNSPIKFGNYITYRKGDDSKDYSFENDFYVNSVSYLHNKAAIETREIGCPSEKENVTIVKGSSPMKYFIKYTREKFPEANKK